MFCKENYNMKDITIHGIYILDSSYYDLIKDIGVPWNDPFIHPVFCFKQLLESEDIYWMFPLTSFKEYVEEGNYSDKVLEYIQKPESDIQSCFYHIAKTNRRSIFLISEALPVPKDFIKSRYRGFSEVKNKSALFEIDRKFDRILKFERTTPNFTKTHITDTFEYMIKHYS